MPISWLTDPAPELTEPIVEAYSEKETYNESNWTASADLRVPWAQRHAIFDNILSNILEWPYRPGSLLWANNGSISPKPGTRTEDNSGNPVNVYEWAILNVNFTRGGGDEGSPGDTESQALYYETIEPNGEMLKLNPKDAGNQQRFYWNDAPTVEDAVTEEEAPTRLVVGLDYVIKWVRLASVPASILDIVDHVNDDTVTSGSLGLSFPAETLLANAPVLSRTITSNPSDNFWNLEIRFSRRKEGWNKYWRAKTMAYESMYYIPDGSSAVEYKNYPTYDFSALLP